VDKPVDIVEKFGFSTAISRICPFLTPGFGVLILPLCIHKYLINRVTETAFRAHNFLFFGEKVGIGKTLDGDRQVFSSFLQKTL